MRSIIIFGASRGLGRAIAEGVASAGDNLYLVARTTEPKLILPGNTTAQWITADLADTVSLARIAEIVKDMPLDSIIYNAGIWESGTFEETPAEEISSIINVNLTSAILVIQKLLTNMRNGRLKKIILIGSTCGLENEGNDSIAYTATKFGLRGVAHALRAYLRNDRIAVSCISPGSIASDIPIDMGTQHALEVYEGKRIPVGDIVDIVQLILRSSYATCLKEIHVPALPDTDV